LIIFDNVRYIESFPSEKHAGAGFFDGRMKTPFENLEGLYLASGQGGCGPFSSYEEWELAEWLVKNAGHGQIDKLLKLKIVSN
jgi:hypothetical protein